jgi:cellulose synthase/poly-beta-1,6-N-acetylglucosamine synthase-like glycosyltransferase
MMQWRPAVPLNGKPPIKGYVPSVDIAICTYKEDINDVVGTIVATQRVEYQVDRLHVYLLDDGRRPDMRAACEELQKSGLLRYQLTYVDRPTNEGYKGGNINNFFRVYQEQAGEFFIILDADMQPFPDMMDIFMGHYFGLPEEERNRVAFIQTPQWYRNFNKVHGWTDFFFISEFFFYRILQPACSYRGCAIYCGCCGLWSRKAIDSIGGFTEGFATEDSVTGCKVIRNKVPGQDYNWRAKYVAQPVAVGVSPDTLPALMAQRLRWYHGMMQMFEYHDYYIFAKGLTPVQKLMYWVSCAGWITNLVNYVATLTGTLLCLGSIAYFAYKRQIHTVELWAFWVGPAFLLIMFLIFSLNPGCSWIQFFHTMSTVFMYTAVYAAAALKHYFKLKIKVQATAVDDNGKSKKWCPFYVLPVVTMSLVLLFAAIATWQLVVSTEPEAVQLAFHVPLWIAYWLFIQNHSLLAMTGFSYTADEWYENEADGELCNPEIKQTLERQRIEGGVTVKEVTAMDDADIEAGDPKFVVLYNKVYNGSSDIHDVESEDASELGDIQSIATGSEESESKTSGGSQKVAGGLDTEKTLGRLNLHMARRIAIDKAIAKHNKPGSVAETPKFERQFLGRASNQTYRNRKLEQAKLDSTIVERQSSLELEALQGEPSQLGTVDNNRPSTVDNVSIINSAVVRQESAQGQHAGSAAVPNSEEKSGSAS